ncbi:invasin domain 3-containing protein [Paenibacillus sp. Marseille-Q9583]
MEGIKRYKRWIAMTLIFMIVVGMVSEGEVSAADPVIVDQKQENKTGNIWVNSDNQRFQTFTPETTGNLSRIELNIFDTYGSTGVLKLKIYEEGNLSTLLAEAQVASISAGWTSVDFSGASPYLTKDRMYRMVASTEFGGSAGFGWYGSSGNPYTRGYCSANNYDFSFRTYMIADYSTSPALSEISSADSILVADGMSQTAVTVKLKDAQGNALTAGGATVIITSTSGTVSAVTDNHNGTYTATLTAPVTVGTATVGASVGGNALSSKATVQFVPGAPSSTNSTLGVGNSLLTADGTSQTIVTVKLKDTHGNALTAGGAVVLITSTLGTVSAVTDNQNGTYTVTLTAPVAVGTATVRASVGGSALPGTATVQFVPGAASSAKSTIEAANSLLTADGTSQTIVTVKLKDAQGNELTTGGATVGITSTSGTVSAVTDKHNGTYTATLTAPVTVGTATVRASVGGSALPGTATVQFVPGAASSAKSTIEAANSLLTADGTSQTIVTVKLKDAQGNELTTGGATVVITSTSGTVSAVTDNHNGTYTVTLTSSVTVGTATVRASVGGSALGTATVQFVPGAASSAKSTIEAANSLLTADGTSQTIVKVKLKDAQGNELTTGGATVVITSTSGTVSAVTDNHNGTYTVTLTSSVTVGTATVSASVGGSALGTATVQFVPGAPSSANSNIAVDNNLLTADGTSQTTVKVKLKDAHGNALTAGGAVVLITSTLGTVSAVTDNHNGTYTAMLKAPVAVGTATVSASVGGSALPGTATVEFVPGAPSSANSTIAVGNFSLTADGMSQTAVTVKLKDAHGNALTAGGAVVLITSTLGTVSAVTDNHNGIYTATLTAPVTVGTATVGATIDGNALTEKKTVEFMPGIPSSAKSTIAAGNSSLIADGTSQTIVTVKLKDVQGNALTTGGATVIITSTSGTVSDVTDNHNGTYTATLTAPVTVGSATVRASVGGNTLTGTATVQFVAGSLSTETGIIAATDFSLIADGTSQTAVTVKLRDAHGNELTAGGAVVLITSTLGTVSTVTDNHNGTYTATLTAPTTVGTTKISASVEGNALASTVTVQFVPGEVSSSHSTITASDLVVRADGQSQSLISVKLKDEYDHPLEGRQVQLQAQDGSSVTKEVYGLTNGEGLAIFAVNNVVAEKVTYSAKEEASGIALDQTVSITFTYDQPPVIELKVDPAEPTFGSVNVTVTGSVYGEFNQVSSIKWAAGSRSISYFDTQGMEIQDHFTVKENGIYSVYVADKAGNANVSLIEIQNIVPLSSNADLKVWQLIGLGGTLKFDFDPEKSNNSLEVSHPVYGVKMLLTPADVYSAVYMNGLQVDSNSLTREYALATGQNKFEVRVKAQDDSMKTYMLNVTRLAGSDPDSTPVPTAPSNPQNLSNQPSLGKMPVIRINNQKVSGIVTVQVDTNGAKSIDALLNLDHLRQVIDSLPNTAEANLSISIEEGADNLALRLSGDTVPTLARKVAMITFITQYGQYRLPLTEIVDRESDWSKDMEVRILMGHGLAEEGFQKSANAGGYQLVIAPIHFSVQIKRNDRTEEVSTFNHFVEKVIYLPLDAGAASTAVVWDHNTGVRPVPTAFITVDGHRSAVVRSFTNSTYAVIYKSPKLTDIQGHWAENEIASMNSRLIVQGTDGSVFSPEAMITRAELAAMLARALGLPEGRNPAGFVDVSSDNWYSGAVEALRAYRMMDGFGDGTFRPNQAVSRQEAIVTMIRVLRLADAAVLTNNSGVQADLDVYIDSGQIAGWASDAVQSAIQSGLIKGYGNELRPQQSLTHAETTVLLYRMLLRAGLLNN